MLEGKDIAVICTNYNALLIADEIVETWQNNYEVKLSEVQRTALVHLVAEGCEE